VIEHFDGVAWHQVAQPVSTYDSFLVSVSADSPTDIWAVGGQSGGTSAPVLVEHFNGTAWTEVANPALPAGLTYYGWLNAVTALAPGDVWVTGAAIASASTNPTRQTLALHFGGTGWQVVPSGNPATGSFESVAGTIPGQPLWVTGAGPTIETTTG
jgi:hypothetical protein